MLKAPLPLLHFNALTSQVLDAAGFSKVWLRSGGREVLQKKASHMSPLPASILLLQTRPSVLISVQLMVQCESVGFSYDRAVFSLQLTLPVLILGGEGVCV